MSWVSLSDLILIKHPHSVIQQASQDVFLVRRNGQYVVCCKHCCCVTIPTHFYQASYWCRISRIYRVLDLLPLNKCSKAGKKAVARRCARMSGSWQVAARFAIREAQGGVQ